MARNKLKLEFPTLERRNDALDFLREFEEEHVHPYGTNMLYTIRQPDGKFRSYREWVNYCRRSRIANSSDDGASTDTYFLVRGSDNRIVGMITIRYTLNNFNWNNEGSIDYCIRRSERLRGYNKINLYLALIKCHQREIEAVLINCGKYNYGSTYTIREFDGLLIREYWSHQYDICNQSYVINVAEAVEKNYSKYHRLICE